MNFEFPFDEIDQKTLKEAVSDDVFMDFFVNNLTFKKI